MTIMPRGLLRTDGVWAEAEITREMLELGDAPCEPTWKTFRLSPMLSMINHAITYIGKDALDCANLSPMSSPVDIPRRRRWTDVGLAAIYAFNRNGVLVDWDPNLISIACVAPEYVPRMPNTMVFCGRSESPLQIRNINLLDDIRSRRVNYPHATKFVVTCEQQMADFRWVSYVHIMIMARVENYVIHGSAAVVYRTHEGNFWSVHNRMRGWGITNIAEIWPDSYVYVSYEVNGCNADITRVPNVLKLFTSLLDEEDRTILTSLTG